MVAVCDFFSCFSDLSSLADFSSFLLPLSDDDWLLDDDAAGDSELFALDELDELAGLDVLSLLAMTVVPALPAKLPPVSAAGAAPEPPKLPVVPPIVWSPARVKVLVLPVVLDTTGTTVLLALPVVVGDDWVDVLLVESTMVVVAAATVVFVVTVVTGAVTGAVTGGGAVIDGMAPTILVGSATVTVPLIEVSPMVPLVTDKLPVEETDNALPADSCSEPLVDATLLLIVRLSLPPVLDMAWRVTLLPAEIGAFTTSGLRAINETPPVVVTIGALLMTPPVLSMLMLPPGALFVMPFSVRLDGLDTLSSAILPVKALLPLKLVIRLLVFVSTVPAVELVCSELARSPAVWLIAPAAAISFRSPAIMLAIDRLPLRWVNVTVPGMLKAPPVWLNERVTASEPLPLTVPELIASVGNEVAAFSMALPPANCSVPLPLTAPFAV